MQKEGWSLFRDKRGSNQKLPLTWINFMGTGILACPLFILVY